MWEQPVTSGISLGVATAAYLLLERSGFTLIALVAHFLLLVVISLFVWSNVATVLNLPSPPLQSIEIDPEQSKLLAEKVTASINAVLSSIFSVLLGKDAAGTFKLAGILYVVGRVGSYFHSVTLLYLITLGLFSVPKLYVLKKKEIDEGAAVAMEYVNKYYDVVKAIVMDKVKALMPKKKEPEKAEEKKTK